MKLTIPRKSLHAGLSTVGRAISTHSSLPILANVLIETDGEGIRLRATDLELGIEATLGATVEQAGGITLPAKTVSEIVAALPDGEVSIETDEKHTGSITCGKSHFRIQGLAATEYPPLPKIAGDTPAFDITAERLRQSISRTKGSVSKDDIRPALTGLLVSQKGKKLHFVSTDTHRLSVDESTFAEQEGNLAALVPGRAMCELLRLLKDADGTSVRCHFAENYARFDVGKACLTTRLLEGVFPKWEKVIPKQHAIRLTIGTEEFHRAVKRAAVIARDDASRLTLSYAEGGFLSISASAGDTGSCREELVIEDAGTDAITFCLNSAYLLDALEAVRTDFFTLDATEPLCPITLRPVGAPGLTLLLMPMTMA